MSKRRVDSPLQVEYIFPWPFWLILAQACTLFLGIWRSAYFAANVLCSPALHSNAWRMSAYQCISIGCGCKTIYGSLVLLRKLWIIDSNLCYFLMLKGCVCFHTSTNTKYRLYFCRYTLEELDAMLEEGIQALGGMEDAMAIVNQVHNPVSPEPLIWDKNWIFAASVGKEGFLFLCTKSTGLMIHRYET